MTPGIECALSYKVDIENDENFEEIGIVHPRYFGNVNIGLKEMNGKMVKLYIHRLYKISL